MTKTNNSICAHVAADHAIRQACLKRLIDDAAIVADIVLAPRQKISQRNIYRYTATLSLRPIKQWVVCIAAINVRRLTANLSHGPDYGV